MEAPADCEIRRTPRLAGSQFDLPHVAGTKLRKKRTKNKNRLMQSPKPEKSVRISERMASVVRTACSGCGRGVVCSLENSVTAYCDRCDFDRSLSQCGSYLLAERSSTNETRCLQIPVIVYSGTQLSFTGFILLCFILSDWSQILAKFFIRTFINVFFIFFHVFLYFFNVVF